MTLRRRRAWTGTAIGSAALAVLTLLAVQGCAPGPTAHADTTVAHRLSITAAQDAYQSYLTASDSAAVQGDATLGFKLVSSVEWEQVKAQYFALTSSGIPVPRYRYSAPQFFVPAESSYPEWFVVSAERSTYSNGRLGAGVRTLLLFARSKASEQFTLYGSAALNRGQALPDIAVGTDGYAIDVPTDDPSLLVRPQAVGPTQAAVVDQGPADAAAPLITSGPLTTGLYSAESAQARVQAAKGLVYQSLLEGADFPQFQLQLANGGALVFYPMYLNTINEHANLVPGSPIPVPAEFTPLLAAPTEVGYHEVIADWAYEFAAVDPPASAHGAKVDVIAGSGAPSYGHAY